MKLDDIMTIVFLALISVFTGVVLSHFTIW